jgi:hypothetical protein
MALGMTTIKIQRARIAYLMAENCRLRRELEKYRRACDVFDYHPTPEPPPQERDYGLGGQEWVDPVSGIDSWDSKQGAD